MMLAAVMMPEARERREWPPASPTRGRAAAAPLAKRARLHPCSLHVQRARRSADRAHTRATPAAPPPGPRPLPVARIALVKPDKARSVENMILAAAQRGAITEKV